MIFPKNCLVATATGTGMFDFSYYMRFGAIYHIMEPGPCTTVMALLMSPREPHINDNWLGSRCLTSVITHELVFQSWTPHDALLASETLLIGLILFLQISCCSSMEVTPKDRSLKVKWRSWVCHSQQEMMVMMSLFPWLPIARTSLLPEIFPMQLRGLGQQPGTGHL